MIEGEVWINQEVDLNHVVGMFSIRLREAVVPAFVQALTQAELDSDDWVRSENPRPMPVCNTFMFTLLSQST